MSGNRAAYEPGFRIRGAQPTRLDAFVDAAFAFAVTLLVISVGHVPESVDDILQALKGLPAFACSFLLIARIWDTHRRWSRYYAIEDASATRLSLALVFVILIYVYPLRLLLALLFGGISDGWLMERQLHIHSEYEMRAIYIVFGAGLAACAGLLAALFRHALRLRDVLALSTDEILATRVIVARWIAIVAIALISMSAGWLLPVGRDFPWLAAVPGLVYLGIPFVLRAVRLRMIRRSVDATAT